MPSIDLRPLSLGELLDRTFSLYRKNFWLVVGIMLLPQAVVVLATLGVQRLVSPASVSVPFPNDPAQAAAHLAQMMGSIFLGLGIYICIVYAVHTIALGATTFAVSDVYLGRSTSISAAFAKLRGRITRLLGLNLAVVLVLISCYFVLALLIAIFAGLLSLVSKPLAVLGGVIGFGLGVWFLIWMFLGFIVAVPSLLLENSGVITALKRSSELLRGNRGRAFLIVFLMLLMTSVVSAVFQGPFLIASLVMVGKGEAMSFWLTGISAIAGGIGVALSAPLMMIAVALLYYDVRVRKEAFDLQVMISELDGAALPAAPTTPPASIG
ncbi:MAG TPA: hypothetical protein VOA41_11060 [Candidatus Dormibacteraeota bacterium]|nr:hypothetical protein [Candidatus Dormibacteraeota bacterium]